MSDDNDTIDEVQGERSSSPVGTKKTRKNSTKTVLSVLGIIGLAGAAIWLSWPDEEKKPTPKGPQTSVRQTSEYVPPPVAAAAVVQPGAAMAVPAMQQMPAKDEEEDKLLAASRRAPLTSVPLRAQSSSGRNGGTGGLPPGVPIPEEKNELESKLQATKIQGVRAGLLGNRNFIIAQGTSIPCVLETAMSSDQPGFVTCVITRDVLSDNGRVVLLDRGTQVTGEYRGGIKQGQKRLFVLWSRAKTPKGVIVALASPGTDALGRAGFDGEIDTHWWERFGSSLVLSLVDDLAEIGTSRLTQRQGGSNNNQATFSGTQDAGKEAAAIALEGTINIPPTLTKNQGELVNIMVARDLDFSTIYGLKVTEKREQIYDRGVTGEFERYTGVQRR